MPELPEVETMVRRLQGRLAPNIMDVSVLRDNGKYLPGTELKQLREAHFMGVRRRGKFIVFDTDRGLLVCHNAMSGYWDLEGEPWTFDYVEGARKASESDVRVKITTAGDLRRTGMIQVFRFHDARLFGSLRFYEGVVRDRDVPSLRHLGPDALGRWTIEHLEESCERCSCTIKELLMDQQHVAGIGNIYATEALWDAWIRPSRPAHDLDRIEIAELHESCQNILDLAISKGLKYDEYLQVYRKKKCAQCEGTIENEKIAGRSTYFCPSCQL